MYGVYLHKKLMEEYESERDAFEAAIFATSETGVFHEVRVIE